LFKHYNALNKIKFIALYSKKVNRRLFGFIDIEKISLYNLFKCRDTNGELFHRFSLEADEDIIAYLSHYYSSVSPTREL